MNPSLVQHQKFLPPEGGSRAMVVRPAVSSGAGLAPSLAVLRRVPPLHSFFRDPILASGHLGTSFPSLPQPSPPPAKPGCFPGWKDLDSRPSWLPYLSCDLGQVSCLVLPLPPL